ncbi:MAG: fumarylacetoacetate hydrolase family protein [Clostridia bacterium]|nr:fumarylacetoacetate hydrolase family protein [Clostridia bacterium]
MIRDLSTRLIEAELQRRPIAQITVGLPEMTIDDAYAVQTETIHRKTQSGDRIVGKKIGLTSKPMQALLGVCQPDYGILLSSMVVDEFESVDSSELIQPKAEGEIAFVLQTDLHGPGVTAYDVLRATDAVIACIEIVDSRIENWKIRIQDTVADNASSARLVLGGRLVSVRDLDLRLTGMVLRKNGEIMSTGAGAAVLGHPASAVAWLANQLGQFGVGLKAGEVVLSGAITAAVPVSPGDAVCAEFGHLGTVTARFR